jgi:hypothetical protein
MLLLRSSHLLRALGNEGDGVSSAFPEGKQKWRKKELLELIITVDINSA